MKITIESTAELFEVDGHPARLWKGHTEHNVPVVCYITVISPLTHDKAVTEQFDRELNPIAEPYIITRVEPS